MQAHSQQETDALFNRPQPFGPDGRQLPFNYDRFGKPIPHTDPGRFDQWKGGNRKNASWLDCLSLRESSNSKRRIPNTSVVNKVCDFRVLLCDCSIYRCGIEWNPHLTAAQYIWWLNVLCFFVHGIMTGLTFGFAYGWGGKENLDHQLVTIYRIKGNWTSATANGYEFALVPNEIAHVNMAYVTAGFFGISCLFHLFAVVAGAFEIFWFIYWRWVEYSLSASLMAFAIAISVGIREQNTLSAVFMLHWVTMYLGLFTEIYSRPKIYADTQLYDRPVRAAESKRLQENSNQKFEVDYANDTRSLKIIDQSNWDGDRTLYNPVTGERTPRAGSNVGGQRFENYVKRMYPHILGIFPFVTAWVIIINQIESAKYDLSIERPGVRIPEWVNAAIYGTVVIFSAFAIVQIIYQSLPPGFYWGSEVCYCVLSLGSKLYLGIFLLVNVIQNDNVEESLSGANVLPGQRIPEIGNIRDQFG